MAATKTKKSASSGGRPTIGSSHSAGPKGGKPTAGVKKTAKKAATLDRPVRPKKKAAPPKEGKRAARGTATGEESAHADGHAPKTQRTIASEAAAQLALAIAAAALDKKAVNVQIVDVVGRVDYADYLVVMSGRSDRHVLSVADAIEEALRRRTPPLKPSAVEGRPQGNWVVIDFGDVVAHVFQEDARSFYDLDSLWRDARRVPLSADQARA